MRVSQAETDWSSKLQKKSVNAPEMDGICMHFAWLSL